ncbi:MAG: hypothetical protein P1U40_09555 [Coxiellaceae bacterium]|nr:hypothetical protein [Coxiellaceae bacterium]
MRNTLVILMSAAISLTTITAFANSPIRMNLEQAMQNCPALDQLTYTPASSVITKKGRITGNKNAKAFTNLAAVGTPYVARPKTVYANNTVANANYRQVAGNYGFISNGAVTCLYSYPAFTGMNYNLGLRSH